MRGLSSKGGECEKRRSGFVKADQKGAIRNKKLAIFDNICDNNDGLLH